MNIARLNSHFEAVDKSGALTASEKKRRLATFETGPCPALKVLTRQRFEQPRVYAPTMSPRYRNESEYVGSDNVRVRTSGFGSLVHILTRLRGNLRKTA